ncbi:acetyl-CoA acetyltransferase [Rhizodiscina lignyota]|uniref:Acetyl-CoA acetyltransferase n=1 Tax=Rhizodiscina lignyota TaxID=1504668 RepID=A0A9P4M4K3_9PEZI|nr:acetyl-CoA acetyltransferase [Rhizodiscina lignyota]
MSGKRATPIVVGVGDFKNRSTKVEDAIEPLTLMLRAINLAIRDTGLKVSEQKRLRAAIDSIDVVRSWTWPYPDLPGLLAEKLLVDSTIKHKSLSAHAGSQPGKLFDEAARRVAQGECKVALLIGGEALASLTACAKAGKLPPPGWTRLEEDVKGVFSPTARDLGTNLGAIHSIGAPIHVYPLYENGFRAHRGQSIQENDCESGKLYGDFAKVAEKNPYAWSYGQPTETAESISKVTKRNRMICFPYPLLMNAFNTVNIAGACLLTSTEHARQIGIPESKWIYPLGGAGTSDSANFWERPNYYSAPCISRSIDAALDVSGLTKDEIDLHDFYSCFPIVPKLACNHLGLSITDPQKPITLLGGLTSFGGAGNNYSMHSLTEMVRQLRKGAGRNGLVLANGGVITYQHIICLSSSPRRNGPYPDKNPLPAHVEDVTAPEIELSPDGEATIETYTVEFDRDGAPLRGYIIGRLTKSGHRFLANHGDARTLTELTSRTKEPIGRKGWVKGDPEKKGRNLFTLEERASL